MADSNNIFAGSDGTVKNIQTAVKFKDPTREGSACIIQVNDKNLTDDLILLSVTGSGEVNLQIDVNFNNDLFVTVFGDKLTPLSFRGLALPSTCDGSYGTSIIEFFDKYKASANSVIPIIKVSYNKGDFVFKGILTKMTLNPYSKAGADAFTFDMTLQGRVMSKQTSTGNAQGD